MGTMKPGVRSGFLIGMVGSPLLIGSVYLAGPMIGVRWSDPGLVVLVVVPALVATPLLIGPRWRRQAVSAILGWAASLIVIAIVVCVGIAGLSALMSDPG